MKDLAQATLAFLGDPGDAKDKSRVIFENESTYRRVFPESVRAQQLLLPWAVYLEAERLCEEWSEFPGASYARYCLVAIVGEELSSDHSLPQPERSAEMMRDTTRVAAVVKRGQNAITSLVAALGEDYPGHREFFRSADFFGKVLATYRRMPR